MYYGYKAGCLDLSNTSLSLKWFVGMGEWLESVPDKMEAWRTSFQDKYVKGQDKDECETNCQYLGTAEAVVVAAIIPTACLALFKSPACFRNPYGLIAVGSTITGLTNISQTKVTSECIRHICKGK